MTVERDYPARLTNALLPSIGLLMEKIGNGGKGIARTRKAKWTSLRKLNYTKSDGPAKASADAQHGD